MKLPHEFIQLPILFDVQKMAEEVNRFDKGMWVPHHEGFAGNFSIPLISVNGQDNNKFKGPMAVTRHLQQCAYLKQVIASFGEVIGRSRLMGLAPGCEVPFHSDINYHWYKRVRIHIPIITEPSVIFHCGGKSLHMKAGEAWLFDSWKYHRVENNSDVFRVHLVVDISGGSKFWRMVETSGIPLSGQQNSSESHFKQISWNNNKQVQIATERFNMPLVMSPGEMDGLIQDLLNYLDPTKGTEQERAFFRQQVTALGQDWRLFWSQFGLREEGWRHYHQLRIKIFESVKHLDNQLFLDNGTQATRMLLHCIIDPALNPEVKGMY